MRRLPFTCLTAIPLACTISWLYLGKPLHAAGLLLFWGSSSVAAVLMPGIAMSLAAAPLLLVPPRARIWWRRGREHRPTIRSWLYRAVLAADRYRCCWCGGSEGGLQLDHIRPWSRGGLTALWNMMTLCARCNQLKSNYWVARDGYVFYRPYGRSDPEEAGRILAFELRHRWSLLRWLRAGWSIGM